MNSGNSIFHECWDNEEGFRLQNWETLDSDDNLLVQDARSIIRDPINNGAMFDVKWYSQGCEQWVTLPCECGGPPIRQAS